MASLAQSPAVTTEEESKVLLAKRLSQTDRTTEGEEMLFNARLMEENDSSGFIYQSRTDDCCMLMASGVEGTSQKSLCQTQTESK